MFGVVAGEVELRRSNGAVRRIGPDDTFGEMAIIDSSPRSGTVVAVTDTKLAVIDRDMFLFLVRDPNVRAASDVKHRRAPSRGNQVIWPYLSFKVTGRAGVAGNLRHASAGH